jgi:ABC-2 type transport system permease protein
LRASGWQVLAGVLVNAIYAMKNFPIIMINTVLSPLSLLIVITFASRGQLIGEAIEGGFILTMFSAGMSLQRDLTHYKTDFKLQDFVVSTPSSAGAYVAGMAIGELIYSLPALAVLVVLGAIYLHPGVVSILQLVGVLLLMFLASVTLGFTLSTFANDIIQSWAFSNLISTLFSTLPPVYYPITYIPLPYQYLAYVSPTTYAAEIAQSATGIISLSAFSEAIAWIVLVAASSVFLLISLKKARWREI